MNNCLFYLKHLEHSKVFAQGNKTDDWGESVLQRVHMLERRISELEMRAGKIPNRPPVTFQTVAEATIHNSYELGGVVSEGKPQKSAAAANKRKPSQLPTTPIKAARKLPHLDTNILSGFGSASETAKDFTEPNTPNSPLGLKTSTLTPRSLQSAASRCKSSPRAKLPLKKAKQDYEALISSPNINRRISYGKPKADRMGRWKEPSIKRKKSKIIISKTASDKENSVP